MQSIGGGKVVCLRFIVGNQGPLLSGEDERSVWLYVAACPWTRNLELLIWNAGELSFFSYLLLFLIYHLPAVPDSAYDCDWETNSSGKVCQSNSGNI
mgnify:CR=1 FL=1